MGIEEIGERTTLGILEGSAFRRQQPQHVLDDAESMVAVLHTCPEVDFPAQTPARGHITALLQGDGSSLEEFGMGIGGYLIAGIKSVEMRDMAVFVLRIITVNKPFLQLSVLSHLHRRQQGNGLPKGVLESLVGIQDFCRTQGLRQSIEDNLIIHRTTGRNRCILAHGAMLGTHRGNGHEPAILRMDLHEIKIEKGRSTHHGIPLTQELAVAVEEIMLPQMGGKPGSTMGEHAPIGSVNGSGDAPEIRIVMSHPTTAAVHFTGRNGSRLTQITNQREQRTCRFCEIRHLSRPVVHLGIDVNGVFRIPRGIHLVVPNALQIGSLTTLLGRRDKQIAPVIEHQRHHSHILTVLESSQTAVGGQRGSAGKRKLYLIILGLVKCFMASQQLFEGKSFHFVETVGIARSSLCRHVMIVHEIGGCRNQQCHRGGLLHEKRITRDLNIAVGKHLGETFGIDAACYSFVVNGIHMGRQRVSTGF